MQHCTATASSRRSSCSSASPHSSPCCSPRRHSNNVLLKSWGEPFSVSQTSSRVSLTRRGRLRNCKVLRAMSDLNIPVAYLEVPSGEASAIASTSASNFNVNRIVAGQLAQRARSMSDEELSRLFEDLLNAESEIQSGGNTASSKNPNTTGTALKDEDTELISPGRGTASSSTNSTAFSSNQQEQQTYTFSALSSDRTENEVLDTTEKDADVPRDSSGSSSAGKSEEVKQKEKEKEKEEEEEEESSKSKMAVGIELLQKFAQERDVEDIKLAAASIGTISAVGFLASLMQRWFFPGDESSQEIERDRKQPQQTASEPPYDTSHQYQERSNEDRYDRVQELQTREPLRGGGGGGVLWQRKEAEDMASGGQQNVHTKGEGVLWTRRDEGETDRNAESSSEGFDFGANGGEKNNLPWEEMQNRALNNNVE